MRRTAGLFFVCALALPLVVAASASAQGSNLIITPKTASPGQTVNVRTFSGSFTNAAGSSGVIIRDAFRDGRVLRSTTADARGNINVDVPLPADLSLGWHLLIATQTIDANNRQRSFTPGRGRLRLVAGQSGAAAPGGGGGSPAPPLFFVLGALALLAAGTVLTARRIQAGRRAAQSSPNRQLSDVHAGSR